MDKQEFFQSYMDHWGITDVLVDCYVDLLTKEMLEEKENSFTRMIFFKQLLSEHHMKYKEQQVFEEEIRQLQDELKRMKTK